MSNVSAYKLIIEDDEGKRSIVPIELGEVSIGRDEHNVIRLNERNVSRKHARFSEEKEGVFAEDLDSYNGILLNGDRITGKVRVCTGDLFTVGDFQLELRGEGLERRSEETTQPTQPDLNEHSATDATNPVIRRPEPTALNAMANPPNKQRSEMPTVPLTPKDKPSAPVVNSKHEPTAIIRLEDLEKHRNQTSTVERIEGARPRLICLTAPLAGKEFQIKKTECILGRTDENDIEIDHRSVSRNHAKIIVEQGSCRIVDMGSANGIQINGDSYSELGLSTGDLLELGHVEFRFIAPGEAYVLTSDDKDKIREARGAKGARAEKRSKKERDSGSRIGEGSLDESLLALVKANPIVVGATGTVLGILLIVLLSSGDPTPVPTAVPTPVSFQAQAVSGVVTPTPSVVVPAGATALLAQAKLQMAQKQWDAASILLREVLGLEPTNSQAITLLGTVQSEQGAKKILAQIQNAMIGREWRSAWELLDTMPSGTSYSDSAVALRENVKRSLLTSLESGFHTAIADEDWTHGEEVVIAVSEYDEDKAEELSNLLKESKPAPVVKKVIKKAPVRRAKPKKVVKRTPKGDPKLLYVEGTKLLKAGKTKEAIAKLSQCLAVSKSFCRCHRTMGIAYARSGDGPKAARYYRSYLKCDPNTPDAPQVRRLLEAYGG